MATCRDGDIAVVPVEQRKCGRCTDATDDYDYGLAVGTHR
ncbi:hypothetical protein SMNI109538_09915 [Smaragdicoccus niigatensis]